jgi:serine/threonine protein kinase
MSGTLAPRRRNDRTIAPVGATIGGRYRLESVLGAGAMGTVFGARHTVLDRAVALKVVSGSLLGDPALSDLLLDEARAAARVAHPSLAQVFDAGIDEPTGDVFLAMERLDGETLRAHLDRRETLAPSEAVALLAPVLDALSAAHAVGIVHRDVKPENIMLASSSDGAPRPTLIDFGIARVLAREPRSAASAGEGALGTPAYMSPEQRVAPAAVDARADLWSVALVMHECVTGRAPAPCAAPDLADLSPPLRATLARALDADPARRFDRAESLRDALVAAVAPPRARRRAAARSLLALLATLALVAATRAATRAPAPRPSPPPPPVAPAPETRPAPSVTAPPPVAPATALTPTPTPTATAVSAPAQRRVARRSAALRPVAPGAAEPARALERPWFEPRAGALQLP